MSQYSINVTGEALAAGTAETVLQGVASGSKSIGLVRWAVSFNGVSASDGPVRVELLRLSSAGTSAAFTPVKIDPASDTAMMTARTSHTAEPTVGDVLGTYYITPLAGLLLIQYAPEDQIRVAANGRLGVRCLAVAAVNVSASMVFSE